MFREPRPRLRLRGFEHSEPHPRSSRPRARLRTLRVAHPTAEQVLYPRPAFFKFIRPHHMAEFSPGVSWCSSLCMSKGRSPRECFQSHNRRPCSTAKAPIHRCRRCPGVVIKCVCACRSCSDYMKLSLRVNIPRPRPQGLRHTITPDIGLFFGTSGRSANGSWSSRSTGRRFWICWTGSSRWPGGRTFCAR